jgi:hypothetical protein
MSNKAIFLDIDGVICLGDSIPLRDDCLDVTCLDNVEYIVKQTNALVVLSSTWRLYSEYKQRVVDALKERNISLFGDTPCHVGDVPRRMEIKEFLENNPEITKFAILDDDLTAEIEGSYFFCNYPLGLTKEIAQRVVDYFNS